MIVGTHRDLEEVVALHRHALTRVQRAECELDDINTAIEQLLDGTAPAPRTVFRLQPAPSALTSERVAVAGA